MNWRFHPAGDHEADWEQTLEPMEEVIVEVDEGYQGVVIEALGERKAVMRDMNRTFIGTIRMSFIAPTRGILGFRNDLLKITRGTGIMYQNFYRYQKYLGDMASRQVHNGISLRIVRQYDINSDKMPCRIDVLYGYDVIRPEMACRVWG